MAALVCEICGGKLIGKPGGMFECDSCGMEYSTEWAKAKIQEIKGTVKVEGTVEVQGTVKVEGPVKVEGAANAKSLLKRGMMLLKKKDPEDEDIEKAEDCFNKVLDIDPENGMAYFGLALAGAWGDLEMLAKHCAGEDLENIKLSRHYADAETRKELEKLDAFIARLRKRYGIDSTQEKPQNIEETKARLQSARQRISPAQGLISGNWYHTVILKTNGKVAAVGNNENGQCNVYGWTDIVAISAGDKHTVGLKSDGTVVATGFQDGHYTTYYGQCDVSAWRNIVAISTFYEETVGLKSDGTILVVGNNHAPDQCYNTIRSRNWSDIVAISAGYNYIVGLKSDGTVVTTELHSMAKHWTDITAVSAGHSHIVGLKSDGTVVAVGDDYDGQCNVEKWTDIIAVDAGSAYTVGLKSDGTVVAVGRNESGQCNVSGWTDIVAISAGTGHTVGLKSDGTVVAVGYNRYGQCKVSGWKLFNNIDTIEQERLAVKEEALRRQQMAEAARLEAIKQQKEARRSVLNAQKLAIEKELPTLKGLFSGGRRRELEAKLAQIEHELKTLQ